MKNKFLHVCCVLTSMIAISCGNEQNSTHQRTNTLPIKDAQFTLSEETFGSDVEITRASQPVSKDTAKISDALEAEVSVERDTKTPLTRATIEMSNQHYTIYATQNGQLVANSMIKGTVSGSGSNKKFVPDAGTTSKVQLPAGTYTFVCFNDALAMQPSGELKLADTRKATMEKALLGTKTQTISGKKWQVAFTMEHCFARVRVQLKTYWKINNLQANLSANSIVANPQATTYNADGSDAHPTGSGAIGSCTFANALSEASDYTFTSTSDYVYILPQTNPNDLKVAFTNGELYRKTLSNTNGISLKNFTNTVKKGESYTFKTKIYYRFNYLFGTGSPKTGTLVANPGRKAIAAVVNGNLAIALKNANNGNGCKWSSSYPTSGSFRDNTNWYEGDGRFAAAYNAYNGREETYNGSYSSFRPGMVKAHQQVLYPAFWHAAHYNPGVPSTYTEWFLPSYGELKLAFTALCGFNAGSFTKYNDVKVGQQNWDSDIIKVIMVQAGGSTPVINQVYWSSSEYHISAVCAVRINDNLTNFGMRDKGDLLYVRPFIHY